MDKFSTLAILSQAADWDAAAPRPHIESVVNNSTHVPASADESAIEQKQSEPGHGVREDAAYGICKVKRLNGGSIPILKVLLSNACSYNCAYCVNRKSANVRRASFQPEELARTVSDFSTRGVIQGAFISSGVLGTPDDTMERLIRTAQYLRNRYGYRGYLHLKVIPGASHELVIEAMKYATRVSVNIELPSEESLVKIAPDKTPDSILTPMTAIRDRLQEYGRERSMLPLTTNSDSSMTTGQTTQLIVGASPQPDREILKLDYHLYKNLDVRRVYYSAFRAEGADASLPHADMPPFEREFRLYQADMLFRWYGFNPDELFDTQENLDEELDPKTSWAIRHLDLFPIELMTADLFQLLRIPGMGPGSARKILALRKSGNLNIATLKKLRVKLRFAQWFITIRGKRPELTNLSALEKPQLLRELLQQKKLPPPPYSPQFDFISSPYK
jgi:putative DNA modification/repair radical SAM protein